MPPPAVFQRPVVPAPTSFGNSAAAPTAPVGLGQQAPATFTADDAAMAQAQKHAKWAISALNFEDVPTAVRELRRALETLGAS
jgi:vacuolar protein sorting-associated protein VTA1